MKDVEDIKARAFTVGLMDEVDTTLTRINEEYREHLIEDAFLTDKRYKAEVKSNLLRLTEELKQLLELL